MCFLFWLTNLKRISKPSFNNFFFKGRPLFIALICCPPKNCRGISSRLVSADRQPSGQEEAPQKRTRAQKPTLEGSTEAPCPVPASMWSRNDISACALTLKMWDLHSTKHPFHPNKSHKDEKSYAKTNPLRSCPLFCATTLHLT